ncbi:MAG TPA: MG2 domain-containing protein, partial [Pyrinomonadaceae bacterium]|nr:MG2 domain-containing protein [Pyrinomonadaceae bacterium]
MYAAIIAAAVFIADQRIHKAAAEAQQFVPVTDDAPVDVKPFFSLSTNRTYATSENARLWLDHRGVENLDFRVYRVNDPQKFFAQLSNPHQMGEDEQEELAQKVSAEPSLLERVRAVKVWAYSGIRNYFRDQLKENTRVTFNHKFRAEETARRVPLNVADYARVPLLNPSQLVTSWREPLPSITSYYDRRMIPLGKRESGVYLVEAVGANLRAYTVVVVTDLATVEKASGNGELLVYAVDRRTGEPRADAQVEIVKSKNTIASGRTNNDGIFRAKIPTQGDEAEPVGEVNASNFVILASHQNNFAISDLESFYFNDFGEDTTDENVKGYIYTDRPIYRPNHKVFFKGILRGMDERQQYRAIKENTVSVTVYDGDDARVYEQELPLSKTGTFNGEFTLTEEAPLGTYRIEATTEEGGSTGNFDVAEYKKPEYKVNVATPQKFSAAGTKTKFTIDARYFFGAPVAGAEVKYYIYRTRYYAPYFRESEEAYEDEQDEEQYLQYGNYYSDFMNQGDGKLDASGHYEIEFEVPASQANDVTDYQYRLEAQITDSSRRTIDGSATLIATRGSVIASAVPERYIFKQGQTARITVKTTDYEGHPVPAKLTLKFVAPRMSVVTSDGTPQNTITDNELSSAEINTDRQGEAIYDYEATTPGSISIKTVVQEKEKQFVSLGGYLWVVSPNYEWTDSPYYHESMGTIKLVADKKSYRVGEVAHVLAILPEDNANLLVTTERDNVLSAWKVKATGKTMVLDVPVEKHYAPNVFL